MRQYVVTLKTTNGLVLSSKTIKSKNKVEAEKYAKRIKENFIPLTKAQKEMSENGINVYVS